MDRFCVAVVDGRRSHQADPGVPVVVVVVVEELAAEAAGMLDALEAGGERGPVLERLEVRLAVRVVAGGVGPRVRLGDGSLIPRW